LLFELLSVWIGALWLLTDIFYYDVNRSFVYYIVIIL